MFYNLCTVNLSEKEKVKELEEQINKSSRTIEEQQSSLRAMEATAAKTSSDRSKIMASQVRQLFSYGSTVSETW